MSEFNSNITGKTFSRTVEPVTKLGYTDGASDGQNAVFQDSFNIGYKQGLSFGLELGLREGISRVHDANHDHKMNCHICTNDVIKPQENIGNLYNIQQEKNAEYLLTKMPP